MSRRLLRSPCPAAVQFNYIFCVMWFTSKSDNGSKSTGAYPGCRSCGFAAEVAAIVADLGIDHLDGPIRRVTARDVPAPVAKELEDRVLPSVPDILAAVAQFGI